MRDILVWVRYLRKPLSGHAYFLELRACEVRRIHLPRTSVNSVRCLVSSSAGGEHRREVPKGYGYDHGPLQDAGDTPAVAGGGVLDAPYLHQHVRAWEVGRVKPPDGNV